MGDRVNRDVRHLEQDALLRQLRERSAGAAEADVQQFDERVVLNGIQFHYYCACSPSVERTRVSTSLASTGLTRKPAAPPCATSSCDEVCTSADTTITLTAGSISRKRARTSRPYMPFMTRSSRTMSGFDTK